MSDSSLFDKDTEAILDVENSEIVDKEYINKEELDQDTEVIPEGEPNLQDKRNTDLTVSEETLSSHVVQETEKVEKLYKFPLGRVKHIMKCDPDFCMASQETVFLITKATELFVESLARECFYYTNSSNKKTVSKKDVEKAIDNAGALAFLEGAIED